MKQLCAVIDVGKTNIKIHVIDQQYRSLFCRHRSNAVINADPYPHYDVPSLWQWICNTLSDIAKDFQITVISITTHGATAALVDPTVGATGLTTPIMDYEFDGVASDPNYDAIRPAFSETYSPSLPAGLNLGRQLFWLQRHCPPEFEQAAYVLPYPQYWAWRLSGVAAAEVTSWGCHTDLWAPARRDYSELVKRLAIVEKLPPLRRADESLGTITAAVANATGLSLECAVVTGVHDSNAGYLRYLHAYNDQPFTVVSTGTWVVSFSAHTALENLNEQCDMLANIDINGDAVACARFMGGREFETICQQTGCPPADRYTLADLQSVIDQSAFALPDFSNGSGPFGGKTARIKGPTVNGAALATLYCALMLDTELQLLRSEGDLIIEGAWHRNPLLCAVLAQLRPAQNVMLSGDETGTVNGAAQLALGTERATPQLKYVQATTLRLLDKYRHRWREFVEGP